MIKVLLFAHLQEEIGKSELAVDKDHLTVEQLKQFVESEYHLSRMDQVMTALNEEYALETDIVNSGDVVAFIPPVSGG
ncbi:molybdopterin synthase sulfur carrier subunit [Bacillus ectoiniformans]|uniref:molybdopterin converting factor subunit 1 n=1 Tax=Bacillus ectoiniformans TaxID=1494429 RepID=UPI00195B01E8|nr:molybdopterin converting factor subunit 1 [Bacillus ectoiniformans]MBM7649068.1 molybdopterin synthase sulfur carrier subunit [Bacillus ectoiniformans]